MPTWSGWQNQFLNAAGILVTPPNRQFLTQWASHAPGSCRNNPIDLTHSVSGSTRCGNTVGGFGRSQNYRTHANAAHAFQLQIDTDWVHPLKAALNSGNPFQIDNKGPVVAVLNRWASPSFATWYANANSDGTGGGGGAGGGDGPGAHKGWVHLRRSVNSKMPKSLHASERNIHAALRSLGHAHKVKG